MPITINGSGTVTGISAGGLPDGVITTDDIAANAVTQAKRSEQLTRDTAKSATGTSVDFTGIPSWVKRITVILDGVSTNGSSVVLIQVGAGSISTSNYASGTAHCFGLNSVALTSSVIGFVIGGGSPSHVRSGHMLLTNVTGNAWASSHAMSTIDTGGGVHGGGNCSLTGTLDRVRITTVNGTDTFDAGSINILYE